VPEPLCSGWHASLSVSLGVRTEHVPFCARESVDSERGCVVSPRTREGGGAASHRFRTSLIVTRRQRGTSGLRGENGIVVDRFRTAMFFPREHLSGACVKRNLPRAPVCWSDWLPLDTEPALTCSQMMPRCCMDAWAVVMSGQSSYQASHTRTHAGTIELSSRTLDRVVTVLSMVTSSHQLLQAIESALGVYSIARNTDLGVGSCVVRHIGHGNGKDRIQARLSIPRRRARGYGVGVLKCVGCRPPEHKRQAEYK
jgi:hypothetical protein